MIPVFACCFTQTQCTTRVDIIPSNVFQCMNTQNKWKYQLKARVSTIPSFTEGNFSSRKFVLQCMGKNDIALPRTLGDIFASCQGVCLCVPCFSVLCCPTSCELDQLDSPCRRSIFTEGDFSSKNFVLQCMGKFFSEFGLLSWRLNSTCSSIY